MSCVPDQDPTRKPSPVCRIAYGVLVVGTLIAFLGSFKHQVGGGAYQIHWTLFVFGLVPYVVYAGFLAMANSKWLAMAGIILLAADVLGRVLSPDMPLLTGWQPLWLVVLLIITVGIGIFAARQRHAVHPEESDQLEAEPNGPSG